VLLETPGILQKMSTPCTGPYPVTNVYKNGTIRIQNGIVPERVNIHRITPFNQIECNIESILHTLGFESKDIT
jgi:hypothetical protein